jgi:hypothetical protein
MARSPGSSQHNPGYEHGTAWLCGVWRGVAMQGSAGRGKEPGAVSQPLQVRTRHGLAGRGWVGRGMAWFSKAGRSVAWHGPVQPGPARLSMARQGGVQRGRARSLALSQQQRQARPRPGVAGPGNAWFSLVKPGVAGRGEGPGEGSYPSPGTNEAGLGAALRGMAKQGSARFSRAGRGKEPGVVSQPLQARTWRSKALRGEAQRCVVRRGLARPGKVGRSKAMLGMRPSAQAEGLVNVNA